MSTRPDQTSPDDAAARAAQRRGRIRMLLIGALFAMPVVVSTLLFYSLPEYQPDETTNYGVLIQPARPTEGMTLHTASPGKPAPSLERIWSLVLLDDGDCDSVCAERLLMTRQMRLSLNERRERVQRVLVVPNEAAAERLASLLGAAHPDLKIAVDPSGEFRRFFFSDGPASVEPGNLYLTDPLGNYMMRYAPDAEPRGLRKDVVRLLRASQIG